MPLKKGSSRETVSENISEFHDSAQYRKTKAKLGKKKADKQAVAVALETARRARKDAGRKAARTRRRSGSA